MKTIPYSFSSRLIVLSFVFSFLFITPIKQSLASGGGASYDVNLPIGDLQGLIQQLQDAANQVVGEAGIQIRATVDEVSDQLRQRIDQLHQVASDIIKEVSDELKAQINNIVLQARKLLTEINGMIQQDIKCINQALAERISQIKDAILDIMDHVDSTIKSAVDRIYIRSTMLIDTSSSRVCVVVNSTFQVVAKVVLLILVFILLFWIIRMFWSNSRPASKVLQIAIPVFAGLLIIAGVFLLFNNKALGKIIGTNVPVPNWQQSCDKGDTYYNQFMQQYSSGATKESLKATGNMALEQLNWCIYASVSPEVGSASSTKIQEINAILYPPSTPPTNSSGQPVVSNCGGTSGGGVIVDPNWLSKYNFAKLKYYNDLVSKGIVKKPKINADDYKTNLRTILKKNTNFTMPDKSVNTIKTPVDKIDKEVIKKLNPGFINR